MTPPSSVNNLPSAKDQGSNTPRPRDAGRHLGGAEQPRTEAELARRLAHTLGAQAKARGDWRVATSPTPAAPAASGSVASRTAPHATALGPNQPPRPPAPSPLTGGGPRPDSQNGYQPCSVLAGSSSDPPPTHGMGAPSPAHLAPQALLPPPG